MSEFAVHCGSFFYDQLLQVILYTFVQIDAAHSGTCGTKSKLQCQPKVW